MTVWLEALMDDEGLIESGSGWVGWLIAALLWGALGVALSVVLTRV